jgi:hypothetical protein
VADQAGIAVAVEAGVGEADRAPDRSHREAAGGVGHEPRREGGTEASVQGAERIELVACSNVAVTGATIKRRARKTIKKRDHAHYSDMSALSTATFGELLIGVYDGGSELPAGPKREFLIFIYEKSAQRACACDASHS